jgi:protein gp37
MSDLFHKQVPDEFIGRVFNVMEQADQHVFQVLTKRSSRMATFTRRRYGDHLPPRNVWLGVSVEDWQRKSRINHLRRAAAAVRFLSIEPLIGPMGKIDLASIDWVIVGGESGPGHRPMLPDWVEEVHDQCAEQAVPFFFKQWGGFRPKTNGRLLNGREWNEFPGERDGVGV